MHTHQQEDANEYLEYSYTKFNNESRSRTNSLQNQQGAFEPNLANPSTAALYKQGPMTGAPMPSPSAMGMSMQGMDMGSFMQQMQQMQQMMSQFQMFQMMQQAQPQYTPNQVPTNFQRSPVANQASPWQSRRRPDRQFKEERELTKVVIKTEQLSEYISTDKSRDREDVVASKQLDKYFKEENRSELVSKKVDPPVQTNKEEETVQSGRYVNPFDQMPIRPATQQSFPTGEASRRLPPQSEIKPKPANRGSRKNMYSELDQKPVKGMDREFHKYVQEIEVDQQDQGQVGRNQNTSKPKNFLKKGTRQFLSSARSKPKPDSKRYQEDQRPKAEPFPKGKREVPRPAPKNKQSSFMQTTRLKIQTQENDDGLFNFTEKQAKHKIKSPNGVKQKESKALPKPKPISKVERQLNQSSVESIHDQETVELVKGVIVTLNQFNEIKAQYMMEDDTMKGQMQKMRRLKSKYEEMVSLVQGERSQLSGELEREKELFQEYKQQQMKKINNLKRVAQRQKQAVCNVNYKKEKEELQSQKKDWQKEKDQMKKKDTSSRHFIQKLKKEVEDLKRQLVGRENDTTSRKRDTLYSQKQVSQDKKQAVNKPKFTYKEREKSIDGMSDKDKKTGKNSSFLSNKDAIAKSKTIEHPSSTKLQTHSQLQSQSKPLELNYDDLKFSNALGSQSKNNLKAKSIVAPKQEPVTVTNCIAYSYQQQYKQLSPGSEESERSESEEQPDQDQYQPGITLQQLSSTALKISMVNDQMIQDLFHYDNNQYFIDYANKNKKSRQIKNVENDQAGKIVTNYADGSKEIVFENGVTKQIFPTGYSIIHFKNRDVKQKLPDGTILYFFKDKNVDQITFTNEMNIFRFQNNQVEFHYPDGLIEIRHADGTIKTHHN